MKVLLIFSHTPQQAFGKLYPLGLAYIATILEQNNFEVEIFDMNLYADPYPALIKRLEVDDYGCIGISLRNIDFNPRHILPYLPVKLTWKNTSVLSFQKTCKIIKSINPSSILIAGGSGFSLFPEELMESGNIDIGVSQEGEEIMLDLVRAISSNKKYDTISGIYYKKDNTVIYTGPRGALSSEYFNIVPKRDFKGLPIDLTIYNHGVQTNRGCPFKCTYCTYSLIQGLAVRRRNPSIVLEDIKNLRENYGVKNFTIADCIFAAHKGHAFDYLKLIAKENIDISWKTEIRCDTLDESLLEAMVEAGCNRMDFSPDSGSPTMLKKLGKQTSVEKIKRSLILLNKYPHIQCWYYFMMNTPGETFKTAFETIGLVIWLYFNGLFKHNGRALFSVARIYPETQLYRNSIEMGNIKSTDNLLSPVFHNPFPLNILNFFLLFIYNPIIFPDFAFFYFKGLLLSRGVKPKRWDPDIG